MKLVRIKPDKRIVKSLGIGLLFILLGFLAHSCASIPKLSQENKGTIKAVLKAPLSEIIKGETGFALNDGNNIWYEKISPKSEVELKGTVLLIMGNGQDALSWPPSFISNFTKAGYQVIRYDHRSTGLSTSENKWKKKEAYSLNDMANDAIAILDTLKIPESHIVGVSMGGMIAQIIAIEHPELTASLTSIMSSGNVLDSELPPMSDDVLLKMISTILNHGFFGSKKGQIKRQIIQKRILMGEATGEIDVKTIAQVSAYNLKKREGYDIMAARHHYEAILNSSSRLEKLKNLKAPTLIIHGKNDPVMPIVHSEKLLETIPDADFLWIDNMGHDLPEAKINLMTTRIIGHIEGVLAAN